MFTGIIEEVGAILNIKKKGSVWYLKVLSELSEELNKGSSVAVNGACLTVVEKTDRSFTVDVSRETINRTNFINLKKGEPVNLERAMRMGDRFDGHIVTGHIDGVGKIRSLKKSVDTADISIDVPPNLTGYLTEKGSVALDGISLTVAGVRNKTIFVSIIPFTLKNTTLGHKSPGSTVNIEVDIIARYIHSMLNRKKSSDTIKNFLEGRNY